MAIKASGSSLSMDEIVAEFGGVKPYAIDSYYRGVGNPPFVPSTASGEDGLNTSDIRFAKSGALVNLLIKRKETIFIGDGSKLPEDLLVDQARLAVLQAELFVPIRGQSGMVGWLALGARQSGDPYSTHDIDFLESLSAHASLALERSQVVSALERRIHEMDTITKVAEEINQFPVGFSLDRRGGDPDVQHAVLKLEHLVAPGVGLNVEVDGRWLLAHV